MADGLIHYSERGRKYVDTLKGMMRVNRLDQDDSVALRDEPMRFILLAEDAEDAEVEQELEAMRESGKLLAIYEQMRLD